MVIGKDYLTRRNVLAIRPLVNLIRENCPLYCLILCGVLGPEYAAFAVLLVRPRFQRETALKFVG
jgi:hypothetical protein